MPIYILKCPQSSGSIPVFQLIDIDANGIINVSAEDKATGKKQVVLHLKNSFSEQNFEL